jgi:tetratricopeptide (TPR) repeat protein
MDMPSLDRYKPAIAPFAATIKKGYIAKALTVILFGSMVVLCLVGSIAGSDWIVAMAVACAILAGFLFYLVSIYVHETTLREALATKQRIDTIAAPDDLESGELYERLALSLRNEATHLVRLPQWLSCPARLCNHLLSYAAWKPWHTLAELLFLAAIDQHIQRIKSAPTNLHYHAALANCYVMLAHHYLEPLKTLPLMSWPRILVTHRTRSILEAKGRASSNSAIEELSILSSFAPQQLWVHDQLAISYRELDMPEREIEECEIIMTLCPDDHQSLLRLGILYFHQGKNAKGLEVYERLKPIQPLLAEELIGHYGAYASLLKQV